MQVMNILYIHSHDTGRLIQPYGYALPTPNLQRLAAQGILFRRAFSVAPTCSPSRAGLLTGQSPHNAGMLGLAHRGFSLRDPEQHLAHILQQHGFTTALSGVQHLAASPEMLGYDQLLTFDDLSAASISAAAARFLTGKPGRPFFLSVGFEETHRPFPPNSGEDTGGYLPLPPHLPDTGIIRRDMAGFAASVRQLDLAVGRVLEALESANLDQDTLVICTTDHGPAMPGMKCTLTDRGTGVMLILRGPGDFQGGRIMEPMVSHLDLYPTICELLDIPRPSWLQGRSLLPLIRGETDNLHDALFAEVTYHAAYEPQRSARTSRFKYIRRFGERTKPVLPNIDDSLTKDEWLAHGGRRQSLPPEGLYDLFFDPLEMNNLAGDPVYAEYLINMRRRLDVWMEETNDPLRDGPVPAPPGARVNKLDALSPSEPTVPA